MTGITQNTLRWEQEKALDIQNAPQRRLGWHRPGQEIVLKSKRDTQLKWSLTLSCIFTSSMFLSTAFLSALFFPFLFFLSFFGLIYICIPSMFQARTIHSMLPPHCSLFFPLSTSSAFIPSRHLTSRTSPDRMLRCIERTLCQWKVKGSDCPAEPLSASSVWIEISAKRLLCIVFVQ